MPIYRFRYHPEISAKILELARATSYFMVSVKRKIRMKVLGYLNVPQSFEIRILRSQE
jgi:hypothetical protein